MWDMKEAFYAIAERAIRQGWEPEIAVAALRDAWLAVQKHSSEDTIKVFERMLYGETQ